MVASLPSHDTELWVVSPDDGEKLEAMRAQLEFSFPVLVDSDMAVAQSYGVVNEGSPQIPHPTALLIDQEGTVTWIRVDENYLVRPPVSEVEAALAALGGP